MQKLLLFVLLAMWIGDAEFSRADSNEISQPFDGVRLIHSKRAVPRPIDMWVAEIDMSSPGVSFMVTPSNGDIAGDATAQTTREFITGIGAQIGVNGSFFSWVTKGQYDVSGLSVSNGDAYSPFKRGFVDAINISKDNVATIIRGTGKAKNPPRRRDGEKQGKPATPEKGPDVGMAHRPAVRLYNALSGKSRLVKKGKNVAGNEQDIHPRTAAGITADGKLLLFTCDGRERGRSEGLTFSEMADILIGFGARDAISLDGGGSTTFVMDDPATEASDPKVMNLPCDLLPNKTNGKERPVGNNLAVFAGKRSESKRKSRD